VLGEHTDYNQGLALPFAIAEGVTVRAEELPGEGPPAIEALAADLDERDSFAPGAPPTAIEAFAAELGGHKGFAPGETPPLERPAGWRAYVRGAAAELGAAGVALPPARVEISGTVPHGSGLSSSAALTVAVCLALSELAAPGAEAARTQAERIELARLCSRVENEWAGARTGLLDQLASLFGARGEAVLIDFRGPDVTPVELALDGWRFAIADSGERHAHASSGYNDRRRECAEACARLGVASLREADVQDLDVLPEPLARRARHVIEENGRVREAVAALAAEDIGALGALLSASHASLRDLYEVSTPAVEATVERMRAAGATGARLMGGGFGGSVLALLDPATPLPPGAIEVVPGPGAHVVASAEPKQG
jgi:galactokinase